MHQASQQKGKKGLNRNLEFDCIKLYESFKKIHWKEMMHIPAYQWTYFYYSKQRQNWFHLEPAANRCFCQYHLKSCRDKLCWGNLVSATSLKL